MAQLADKLNTQLTRKLGAMSPKLPSQIREGNGLVIVVMGPSGAGKTSLIPTLVDTPAHQELYGPVAVLDADNKAHVLPDHQSIDVYPAIVWAQIEAHYKALGTFNFPHHTIVWDGLAIMQSKSHTHVGVNAIENAQLRQTAFGRSNVEMIAIAEQAKILAERGINVIFNVWSTPWKDEDAGLTKYIPDVTAKLQRDFFGILDFVVSLECNSPQPYPPIMRTGGSPKYGTRTAVAPDSELRNMPDIIYNPSLSTILDSWHGTPWPTDKHIKPIRAKLPLTPAPSQEANDG